MVIPNQKLHPDKWTKKSFASPPEAENLLTGLRPADEHNIQKYRGKEAIGEKLHEFFASLRGILELFPDKNLYWQGTRQENCLTVE